MNRGGRKKEASGFRLEALEAGLKQVPVTLSQPGQAAGQMRIPGRPPVASGNFSAHQRISISFLQKAMVAFFVLNMQSGFLDSRSRHGRVEGNLI